MSAAIADTMVLVKRNWLKFIRSPELLLGFTIQPIMFVTLFVFVFGGAVETPGIPGDYSDFLMPGIIVQSLSFGGFVSAVGLAEDLNKGLIDRFRSLPMARSAFLAARTVTDIGANILQLVILIAVALLVGFSFDANLLEIGAGILLLLLFGYAFSWVFALMGMTAGSPEAAQQVGFTIIFPLTFISSAFVPPETFPAALEAFSDHNPFTHMTDAIRHFWLGTPAGDAVWLSIVWCIGITVVFAAIAVRMYRKAAVR